MNGRMYDPVIGRVLSPDAFVQDPGYSQSYNRYSYCMNNPLRYTDPSGWLTAAAFESYVNAQFNWLDGIANNSNSYSSGGTGGGGSGGGYNGSSWTDYLHDPKENFVMMSSRAYNTLYGTGTYEKMQSDRTKPGFFGPDKYATYGTGVIVENRFGEWIFVTENSYKQIADYTIIKNVPQAQGGVILPIINNNVILATNIPGSLVSGAATMSYAEIIRDVEAISQDAKYLKIGGNLVAVGAFALSAYNVTAKSINGKVNTSDIVDFTASGTLVMLGIMCSNPITLGILTGAAITYGVLRIVKGDEADKFINDKFGFNN